MKLSTTRIKQLQEEISSFLSPDAIYREWKPRMKDMEDIVSILQRFEKPKQKSSAAMKEGK